MKVSAKTDIGRSRIENQDNYRSGVFPDGTAWAVVCDGMGGGQDGKLASSIAVECIEEQFYTGLKKRPPDKELKELMENSIQMGNTEVFTRSGLGARVMGTTVVCAVIRDGMLHVAHVGDSRAYLFQRDQLNLITHDHSMVQELLDQGVISIREALHHPDKNVITRALGVEEHLQVEYSVRPVEAGSLLLLCTDGLTNMVDNTQIAAILRDTDFYQAVDMLVGEALLAGGTDNITVVLMQTEEKDNG